LYLCTLKDTNIIPYSTAQGHIKITKEQLGKFASHGYTNLILLEIRKCDPATYKEVGLYDVKRNVRNVIPVIFGR